MVKARRKSKRDPNIAKLDYMLKWREYYEGMAGGRMLRSKKIKVI